MVDGLCLEVVIYSVSKTEITEEPLVYVSALFLTYCLVLEYTLLGSSRVFLDPR